MSGQSTEKLSNSENAPCDTVMVDSLHYAFVQTVDHIIPPRANPDPGGGCWLLKRLCTCGGRRYVPSQCHCEPKVTLKHSFLATPPTVSEGSLLPASSPTFVISGGIVSGCSHSGKQEGGSSKKKKKREKNRTTIGSSNPTLVIYLKHMKRLIKKDICTLLILLLIVTDIAALLIMTELWKILKCVLMDEWIKMWDLHIPIPVPIPIPVSTSIYISLHICIIYHHLYVYITIPMSTSVCIHTIEYNSAIKMIMKYCHL